MILYLSEIPSIQQKMAAVRLVVVEIVSAPERSADADWPGEIQVAVNESEKHSLVHAEPGLRLFRRQQFRPRNSPTVNGADGPLEVIPQHKLARLEEGVNRLSEGAPDVGSQEIVEHVLAGHRQPELSLSIDDRRQGILGDLHELIGIFEGLGQEEALLGRARSHNQVGVDQEELIHGHVGRARVFAAGARFELACCRRGRAQQGGDDLGAGRVDVDAD